MTVREFLSVVELRTKVVSLSSLAVGAALAVALPASNGVPGSPVVVAIFVAAVLCVDMGTTAFNTFFDYWNGTDRKSTNFEADKVLLHGGTRPAAALTAALALYAAAAVLGVVLGGLRGWGVVGVGALGMAVGFLYSGGPRPISSTPFGELFAGGFLGGTLVVLTVFVVTGGWNAQTVLFAVPSTLAVASILTVNNACDREADRASGRRTLAILVGPAASRGLIVVLGAAAFGLAGGLVASRSPAVAWVFVAVGAVAALPLYAGMLRRGFHARTKGPNMNAIAKIFVLFSASFVVALALSQVRFSY